MQANIDESTILIVKVKAFFFFAQVKKQNMVLKYIRVQFHENRDFCFVPCSVLGTEDWPMVDRNEIHPKGMNGPAGQKFSVLGRVLILYAQSLDRKYSCNMT